MRNLIFIVLFIAFWSCENPTPHDVLPDTQVNVVIDLSLPSYQELLVHSGWANTPTIGGYGIKGILIYNRGGNYIAYERACPHLDISACNAMVFDGLLLKCTCDNSVFNIFNGGVSQTAGVEYSAREYHVQMIGASSLRITNF
jgi:nitrite reductase/ring-hydroxylating ferredoxin subunit